MPKSKSCVKFTRALVIILSILFAIVGSVISGLVFYIQLTEPFFDKGIPIIAKYVCLGLHISLFVSGVIGFCAAFCFKKWLFSIFLPMLILTYASHLALAASLLINSSLVKETMGEAIDSWQRGYEYSGQSAATAVMDEIHKQFHCCGSQSYKDFRSGSGDTVQIPWSCCNPDKQGIAECQPKTSHSLPFELVYERGCRTVATESCWNFIRVALYASVGLTALELLTVALSLSVCCFCIGGRRDQGRGGSRRYSALPLPDGFPPGGGHETVL